MRKFLALGVFLLFATAVSAAMHDGYVRATGGDVWINGMHVTGVGSGLPIVKFSVYSSGSGYLNVFGEFDCYYADYYDGVESTEDNYWCDNEFAGKRTALTLSWKNGVDPHGTFWVEGNDPMPVVMDSYFGYSVNSFVDVHGGTSGLDFNINGMNVVTPVFWVPLSKA